MEQIKKLLEQIVEIDNKINSIQKEESLQQRKFSPIWWALNAADSALTAAERTLQQMLY